MLRLHTPNVGFARTATRPVRIGDRDIAAGEPVAVVLPAANQDPEMFGRPGELDLTRRERHLAFGDGPHVCPGAVPGRDLLVAGVRGAARPGAARARRRRHVQPLADGGPDPAAAPARGTHGRARGDRDTP